MMDRRTFLESALTAAGAMMVGGPMALAKVSEDNPYIWSAPVWIADKPNGNKRIYPRAILEKIVYGVKLRTGGDRIYGQLGMPPDSITRLDSMSHEVTDMYFHGQIVIARIQVLATPQGKILADMLKRQPHEVAFRSAGIANKYNVDGNGHTVVDDTFRLIGIHAIAAKEAAVL